MEPTICSGDLLLVDRSKLQVRGERIYLINLDDEVMVKRVEWLLDGSVVIRGDNTLVSREIRSCHSKTSRNSIYLAVWCGWEARYNLYNFKVYFAKTEPGYGRSHYRKHPSPTFSLP